LGHHYPRRTISHSSFALIRDLGADPTPFQPLVSFSPFATSIRYDEVAPLGLERSLRNQRCAELLEYVASLLP
jgi:hypothetical protein